MYVKRTVELHPFEQITICSMPRNGQSSPSSERSEAQARAIISHEASDEREEREGEGEREL